jgi:Fe-S cluster assembly protein SufD
LSRALLLSEETEFNAKPELEIYADDVKCSHGSTSGNIDKNAIFYLMSRGLSYNQSRQLLINGFLQEVIEKISTPEIKKLIKKITGIRDEN